MTADPMLALALEAGRRRLAEQSIARGTFAFGLIDGCLFGFVVARVSRASDEPEAEVFIGSHAPSFVFTVEIMNRALRHDGHGPRLEVRVGATAYTLEPRSGS